MFSHLWTHDRDSFSEQVDDCLFNVPRIYFERESEVFRGLFTLPPPPDCPVEGLSDRHPLRLEGIAAEDFRQLLRVMYPW